jgi:uncharacterized RDD family membrane protein YckC
VSEDPFGRRGEEETDAFGRPVPAEEAGAATPVPAGGEELRGGFAPPTSGDEVRGGFAPPTDSPPEPDVWWAGSRPGTIEGRAHADGRAPLPGEPAEWTQRAGAAILDFCIRFGIYIGAVLLGSVAYVGGTSAGEVGTGVGLVAGLVAAYAYAPLMIAKRNGQTLGHRATGTRVVRADGSPLSGGGAFVREVLAKGILFDGILGVFSLGIGTLLNYLWPLWDDRNEALHDKMCSTRVLKA